MSERDGIFAGDDPFDIARRWLAEATPQEPSDANAVALATVDAAGLPNVRIMLLKDIEDDGFVFFSNYESRKAQEIAAAGKAALVLHWKSLARQIRVRGPIEKIDAAASDAYYASRPLGSRIGAWASQQSRPLASRQALGDAVAAAEAEHGDDPARPAHWGGYKIRPVEIEFWADAAFRLHDRFRWSRENLAINWDVQRLNP